MHVTLYALMLFIIAWVIHLGWWRWRPPLRQTLALLGLFFLIIAAGLTAGLWLPSGWGPQSGGEIAYAMVLDVPLTLAYIAFYSAIEEDSPSLAMVAMAQRAGARGCAREDFAAVINDDLVGGSRLDALARDGFVRIVDARCQLTAKGRRWARAAAGIARIFGFHKGA
jgi:hypothetical protein